MSNKLFVGLLIGILVVGAGVGGAFAGGVAYGRGQQEDTTPVVSASELPSPSGSQVGAAPPGGTGITADLRQRLQSGNATPEELQELRSQFQGQNGGGRPGGFGGFGGGGARFGGGGALNGTIESVVDGVLTVNTQQGPLQATLGPDTTIRSVVEVSIGDLVLETRVTITGERSEDGIFEATSVLITPEGLGLVDVGGFFGGSERVRTAP